MNLEFMQEGEPEDQPVTWMALRSTEEARL
jgi:hypothetical protein